MDFIPSSILEKVTDFIPQESMWTFSSFWNTNVIFNMVLLANSKNWTQKIKKGFWKILKSVNDSHLRVRFPRHFFHKLRKWGRCQLPVVVRSRRFGRNLASIWSCNLNVWFLVILGWGWMEIQDNSLVFIGDCGRWWRCGMVTAIFGFLCGNLIILLEIEICRIVGR